MRTFLLHLALFLIFSVNVCAQVGIGTPNPAPNVSLHIKDDNEALRLDGSSPYISFYDGLQYRGYFYMSGDNMYLFNRSAGSLYFGANNATRMAINSSGNAAIGTSFPETRLHVAQGTVAGGSFNGNSVVGIEKSSGNAFLNLLTNSSYESGVLFGDQTVAERGGIIFNNGSTPQGLQFRTNNNQTRMTIDNVGDVGIGIFNPGRPLDIQSRSSGNDFGIRLFRVGSSVDWEMSVFGGNFNFFYNGATTATARITTNGTYQNSDQRLKKNIQPYKPVLPALQKLQVSNYEMLTETPGAGTAVGLVAQNVMDIFPEIVRLFANRDGSSTYAIDYSKTGVLALKAIQELQAEIEAKTIVNQALENRVRDLEERLRKLEAAAGI